MCNQKLPTVGSKKDRKNQTIIHVPKRVCKVCDLLNKTLSQSFHNALISLKFGVAHDGRREGLTLSAGVSIKLSRLSTSQLRSEVNCNLIAILWLKGEETLPPIPVSRKIFVRLPRMLLSPRSFPATSPLEHVILHIL